MKTRPVSPRTRFVLSLPVRSAVPAILDGPVCPARAGRRTALTGPTLALVAGAAILASGQSARAATDTFTGGNNGTTGTNNLSLSTNYTPTATPASGDTLIFGNTVAGTNTITDDLAAGFTLGALTFNAGTLADTISGNSFTLGGNIANNSTNLQTVDDNLSLTGTRTITLTTGGGNFTVGTLGGTDGVISSTGAFGLTMVGTGVLTLNGLNTYTGTTTVNATGTLNINSTSAIGTGQLTIVGLGTINNTSGAAETLTTNNTFSLNSFTFTGTNNLTFGTGTATLGSGTTATITANTLTFGGAFALGTNNLNKAGAGTLVLNGNVTGTNGITVSAGTLTLAGANNITGATSVAPGAILNANGTNSSNGTIVASGTSGGTSTINLGTGTNGGLSSGAISASGSGPTIVLNTPASPVTLTNAINQSGGNLSLGGTSALTLNGNVVFNSGGALSFIAAVPTTVNGTLALNTNGSNALTFAGGSNITLNGVVSSGNVSPAGLTLTNTATLTLAGANTFSGTTTITAATAGTLDLANGLALQNSTLNQTTGMLVFDAAAATPTAFSIGGLSGSKGIALTNNAATPAAIALTLGGANTTVSYSGTFTGAGSLTKVGTGTQTLATTSAINSLTNLTVNAGGLAISAANTGFAGTVNVNGGTLTLNPGNGIVGTLGGTATVGSGPTINLGATGSATAATLAVAGGNDNYVNPINVLGTGTNTINENGANSTSQQGTITLNGGNSVTLSLTNVNPGNTNGVNFGPTAGTGNVIINQSNTKNSGTNTNGLSAFNNVGTVTVNGTSTVENLSFNSAIGANVTGLTINDTGTFTTVLNVANPVFTGDTTLTAGKLTVANATALQSSVLNLNSTAGTFAFGGTAIVGTTNGAAANVNINAATVGGLNGNGNLALTNSGTGVGAVALTVGNSNVANSAGTNTLSPVYSGVLSGAGSVIKTGTDTQTFSGANTYTGVTTIGNNAGILAITNTSALGTGTVQLNTTNGTTTQGTLQLNFAGGTPAAPNVIANNITGNSQNTLASATPGFANLESANGANQLTGTYTLVGTGGTGQNIVTDAGSNLELAGAVSASGPTGTRGFDFGGAGNTLVSGVISNGTASIQVQKDGAGTLTLSAANTYTGATLVNAGTMRVNGSVGSAATPAGMVTVNNAGTLGGTGILTVASAAVNGTLAPGATAGATTGALTLNTTTGLTLNGNLTIGVQTGGVGTSLATNGLLTLGTASTLTVNGTLDGTSPYDIANYGTLAANSTFAGFTAPAGYTINYAGTTFGASDIELDVTAVPEPSTWVGGLLVCLGVGFKLRRRKVQAA